MKRFIKETYVLFIVTALSALASFVTGVWTRNILGPAEYGIWIIVSMILTYGYYMTLGILDGFSRDIPRLLGEERHEKVQRVRNAVFTWTLSSAFLSIASVFIIIMLPLSRFEMVLGIIAVLLVPLQNMTLFHNHLFLTTQQYSIVAIIQLCIGSVQYLLMAVFALVWGIYGLFLGVLAGNIIAILYGRFKLSYRLNVKWDWDILKGMLSYGVPITMIGILLSVLTTLDRIIVFVFFGVDSVGHYGLISLVYQAIMVLPGVFHQVMYPKISHNYGKFRDKRKLKAIVANSSIHLSFFSPIILGSLYIIFPSFVMIFLPQYTVGVAPAKIVVIGMFFLLWAALYAQYLTVVNKQWTYFKILLIAVIIHAILNITFIHIGFHIEGVALGTAITYMVYPMLLMWSCYRDMGEKVIQFAKDAALVIVPFTVMIICILIVDQLGLHFMVELLIYLTSYVMFLVISSFRVAVLASLRRQVVGFIHSRAGHGKQ